MKLQEYDINEQRLQAAIDSGVQKAAHRRSIFRTVLVLSLVLALSLATVATARYLGLIGWDGKELVETEPGLTVEVTEPPTPSVLSAQMDFDSKADALLEDKPDFEHWDVNWDEGNGKKRGRHGFSSESISSLEQGAARARASGMRMWEEAPPGYTFQSLEIGFYFTPQDFEETNLIASETLGEGLTLHKYAPPESIRSQIARYHLELRNDAGNTITLSAEMDQSVALGGFGVQEGASYESLDIPGMGYALYRTNPQTPDRSLYLLQNDMTPRSFLYFFDFQDPAPEIMVYDRIRYSIRADGLTEAELIELAEALY